MKAKKIEIKVGLRRIKNTFFLSFICSYFSKFSKEFNVNYSKKYNKFLNTISNNNIIFQNNDMKYVIFQSNYKDIYYFINTYNQFNEDNHSDKEIIN